MRRAIVFVLVVLVLEAASTSEALTKNYIFIPGESTLRQTGGYAGIDELFTIKGYFDVTIDFDASTAQFDYVSAIATNDSNYGPHDINEVFQMTQLVSTEVNEFSISFEDTNPPMGGIEINLVMAFQGGQVHLTGTRQWPSVPDSYQFDIDAIALDTGVNYIYVDDDGPADFNNIQAAINSSGDGDIIIVADGIYTGAGNKNLDFGGRAITVRSQNGPEATVIDCENHGRGFYFHSGEGPDSIVSGLTITNGRMFIGGGIYCEDSSPTIHNNIITGNFAPWDGVEIPGFGGGILCMDSSVVITGNVITNNSAEGRGGGICAFESSLILNNNLIAGNHAFAIAGFFPGPGYGGGISCEVSSVVINNNTISDNFAHDLSVPFEVPGDGGGIDCGNSTLILVNDIIWSNSPNEISNYGSDITLSYCDIDGGWAGEGNINIDPLFADPCNGNYHLQSEAGRWDVNSQSWMTDTNTSECIDAGDPNSDWKAELWPHGKRINMGAYGGTPQASMSLLDVGNIADLDNDGDVDYNDLMLFTDKWPVEQVLLAEDFDRNGKVDFDDYAIYGKEWFNEYIGEPEIDYQITPCGIFPLAMDGPEQNRFSVTVEGSYIHFEDTMVANCCPTALWLEMYVGGDLIIISEKEYGGFCLCICDNPVEAELGPFKPGTYTLEVYEDWGGFIGSTIVVIE